MILCLIVVAIVVFVLYAFNAWVQVAPNIKALVSTVVIVVLVLYLVVACWRFNFAWLHGG